MSENALSRLATLSNLECIWKSVAQKAGAKTTPGVDGITVPLFNAQKNNYLKDIRANLLHGYTFSKLRGVAVPKTDVTKYRLICVPTLADRIVQRALLVEMEKKGKQLGVLNDVSHGFIAGGARTVSSAQKSVCRIRSEKPWILKADISKFFDRIDRDSLFDTFSKKFRFSTLHPLIKGAIQSEVEVKGERVELAIRQNGIIKGKGLRQGMPISPFMSNFALSGFDKIISSKYSIVRYADDLIVLGKNEDECKRAKEDIECELYKIGQTLNEDKTYIRAPNESVEFLGLELRLCEDGLYRLLVSKDQLKAIKHNFREYHDVHIIVSKGLNSYTLFKKIKQMQSGYLSAYACASNFKRLEESLEQCTKNCAEKVYGSIFGKDKIKELTTEHRKFLMLP